MNLYLLLLNVPTCKFQYFFKSKQNLMSFSCISQDCMWLYFVLLAIWKAPVVKRLIHIQSIKITSNSLFPMTNKTKCWNLHVDTFNNNMLKTTDFRRCFDNRSESIYAILRPCLTLLWRKIELILLFLLCLNHELV